MIQDLIKSPAVENAGEGAWESSGGNNRFNSLMEEMAYAEDGQFSRPGTLAGPSSLNVSQREKSGMNSEDVQDEAVSGSVSEVRLQAESSGEADQSFPELQDISIHLIKSVFSHAGELLDPLKATDAASVTPVADGEAEILPGQSNDQSANVQSDVSAESRGLRGDPVLSAEACLPLLAVNVNSKGSLADNIMAGRETRAVQMPEAGESNHGQPPASGESLAGNQSPVFKQESGVFDVVAKVMTANNAPGSAEIKLPEDKGLLADQKIEGQAASTSAKSDVSQGGADEGGEKSSSGNEYAADARAGTAEFSVKSHNGVFRETHSIRNSENGVADEVEGLPSQVGPKAVEVSLPDGGVSPGGALAGQGHEKLDGLSLRAKAKNLVVQEAEGMQSEFKVLTKGSAVQASAEGMSVSERVVRISDVAAYFDKYVSIAMDKPEGLLSIGLHPQNLGRMTMTCREDGGNITVDVVVESNFVRGFLVNHEAQLKEVAAGSGFNVTQFNVRTDPDGQRGERHAWDRSLEDRERDEKSGGMKESRPRFTTVTGNKVLFVA